MDTYRKKVSDFTQKLQTQTDLPLWSIADEAVIYAAFQNKKLHYGRNGKKIRFLMAVAKRFGLVDYILFIIGLIKSFLIWKKIRSKAINIDHRFEKVFAGFGASSEEHFREEIRKQSCESLLWINWINYEGMEQLGCPSFGQIFSELYKNAFGHTAKFKNAISEIQKYELDFLTIGARHIGSYVFFCSYWKNAKLKGVREVTFLVPDVPAYACVEAGVRAIFTQHGLLSLSVLMPKLQKINAITKTEEDYFRALYSNIEIARIQYDLRVDTNKQHNVIILSPNISLQERLRIMKPFIDWARSKNMKIIIRPTSKITSDEMKILQNELPCCIVDDIKTSIYRSLETWQPKFVAAWTSTGLAIALEYGYLPISFYHSNEPWNMVYPLDKRVLFWPLDKNQIEKSLTSSEAYLSQVEQLQYPELSENRVDN